MINFPFLPVEGLHEYNLDWFLKRFHELSEEWDETKAAWLALKEWVENYFEDTDFVEKIHNALDEMFEDGRLSEVMYQIIGNTALPVFVDSTSEMTHHNKVYVLKSTGMIYFWDGEAWVATGLTYPDAKSTVTSSNIVLTADNMQGYTSADEFTNNQIYAFSAGAWRLLSDMPLYSMPQDGVIITYVNSVTTNQPAKTQILVTPNRAYTRFKWGASQWGKWQYLKGGMLITPTSEEGVTDADSIGNNTTYMIQSDVTEERMRNLPRYGLNGVLTSYGYGGTVTEDNAGVLQTFTTERFTYYRLKWAGIWGRWHKSTTNDYIQSHGQATFSDSATIQPNSISLIMSNITSEDITGLPRYGLDGWLLTFSYLDTPDTNNFIQIYITGWNIYFRFKINGTAYPWRVWGMQTNNLLFLQSTSMTGYPDYQDCNTFPLLSYVVASVTPEQIANMPEYETPLFIMTYGNREQSQDGRFQIAFSLQNNEFYYRSSWAGAWTAWKNDSMYGAYNQKSFRGQHSFLTRYIYADPNTIQFELISFGDSLTTSLGGGGGRNIPIELSTYCMRQLRLVMHNRNIPSTLTNYGVSGNTIVDNLETQVDKYLNSNSDFNSYGLISIIMGTNDITNNYNVSDIFNVLTTQIDRLITQCPNKYIVYVSPIPRHSGGINGMQYKNAMLVNNLIAYYQASDAVKSNVAIVNGQDLSFIAHTADSHYRGFESNGADGVHPIGWVKTRIAYEIYKTIV